MLTQFRRFAKSPISWVIIALLIVSFAVWGVSDIFRGGGNAAAIVGTERVTVAELRGAYQRALLQRQREQPGYTQADAEAEGLGEQVFRELTVQAAIDAKARALGLRISDEVLAEEIRGFPAFQNPVTGQFDRARYNQLLRENQLTEQAFEADVAAGLRRELLISALLGGLGAPEIMVQARAAYLGERREVSALLLAPVLAGALESPDDATLQAFLAENAQIFQIPETRRITLVRAAPDLFTRDIDIPEADIQALYETRLAQGELADPPTRTVTIFTTPDAATAQAVAARLADGAPAAVITEDFNLEPPLTFEDAQAFEIPDQALREAAFAMSTGQARAVEGRLGWRALRVEGAEDPEIPSFEAVRADLRAELAFDAAETAAFDALGLFEEARAAGAPLEQAAEAAGLQAERFDFVTNQGFFAAGAAAQTLQRAPEILETAFALPEAFESDLTGYGDGGYFAARVDAIAAPRLPALDEARADVETFWRFSTIDERLSEIAAEARARLQAGESAEAIAADLGLGARAETAVLARGEPTGPFHGRLVAQAFLAERGSVFEGRAQDQRTQMLVRVDAVLPADVSAPAPGLETALREELRLDFAVMLERALLEEYPPRIDDRLRDQALGRSEPPGQLR